MPYLIDGHNLISQLPDIQLSDPDDEAKLVHKLRGFSARDNRRIEVVFDGGIPGGSSQLSTSRVKVFFASAFHTDADSVIKSRIREIRDIKGWIIVSSDREVRKAAEDRGMRSLNCVEFMRIMARPDREEIHKGIDPNAYVPPTEVSEFLELFGTEAEYERPKDAPPIPKHVDELPEPKPAEPVKKNESTKPTRKQTVHTSNHLSTDEINFFLRSAGEPALGEELPPKPVKESKRFRKAENRRRTPLPRDIDPKQKDKPIEDDPYISREDIDDWHRYIGDED